MLLFRLECKQGHGYKKVQVRRSGDRYIDHTNGVALMLLLEFGETDPALIMAAMGHDTLEDVELSQKYYPKLLGRVAGTRGEEVVHLIECVTNPTKTGDEKRDSALKAGHYELIGDNTKASKIKIADRCYNLRTLEVHQKDATDITEKDIQTADKQLEETENFILPLAEKIGGRYQITLGHEINMLRKRLTEVQTARKSRELTSGEGK